MLYRTMLMDWFHSGFIKRTYVLPLKLGIICGAPLVGTIELHFIGAVLRIGLVDGYDMPATARCITGTEIKHIRTPRVYHYYRGGVLRDLLQLVTKLLRTGHLSSPGSVALLISNNIILSHMEVSRDFCHVGGG